MKALARDVRARYGVTTGDINLTTIRRIYREEGIVLDYWDQKLKKVRGAYTCIDGESFVMVKMNLPKEPRIFCLCHELKHHYVDQHLCDNAGLYCQDPSWEEADPVEISAEIFAAEFIFPEQEFLVLLHKLGLEDVCRAEGVVHIKRNSLAPISYKFIQKRLSWFGVTDPEDFRGVQFRKLEESIYGVPFYKTLRARRR